MFKLLGELFFGKQFGFYSLIEFDKALEKLRNLPQLMSDPSLMTIEVFEDRKIETAIIALKPST